MRINTCKICEKNFIKPHNSMRVFKYCSIRCMANDKEKAKQTALTLKGCIPWNKGIFGIRKPRKVRAKIPKELHKIRQNIFQKGMTPWNKGSIGIMKAWNKGIKKEPTPKKIRNLGICLLCRNNILTTASTKKQIFCSQKCHGAYRVGINNPRWITDRTQLKDDHKDRWGQLHRDWSRQVKNRDNWKCRIANTNCEGRVESHHILSWKEYPELRYKINNGITLCHFHHPRKRQDEINLSSYFKELVMNIK